MSKALQVIYILIGVSIFTTIVTVIFHFIGVEFKTYGNYLLWIIALALFYILLPSNEDSVF
jgi:hypothetical protein